jgi:hypothetical protein
MKPEIIRTVTLAEDGAHFIADCATQSIDDYGHFRLCLSCRLSGWSQGYRWQGSAG